MATPTPHTMEEARQQLGPDATIVGVIGSPVAHSLSPVLHNAAFAALGLGSQWHSFAFEIAAGAVPAALWDMRRFDVRGLSVTMPHKADVAAAVDELSEEARILEAVNCVINRDGVLRGANTDGEGFVASLQRGSGFDPGDATCLVVGAGGAARAVLLALAGCEAGEVVVLNRTLMRARAAVGLAGNVGSVVESEDPDAVARVVAAADLVVNATPIGMAGTDSAAAEADSEWLVPPTLLRKGQVVVDLVYAPRPTPWLASAAKAGATTLDGLGMLVHQAAAQVTLWTGQEAPVTAMWDAAEAASPAD
ncbi:MAG TPA: shikimate dehydrogenase [Acidimicrobiales bacterium]|nr:shikimate dehydrogenase [Acidimicrobiales bacterium]